MPAAKELMTFIKLTNWKGEPIVLNIEKIIWICCHLKSGKQCTLIRTDADSFYVNDLYEDVIRLIPIIELDSTVKEEYRCKNCGSPLWEPGGMGLMYKKCTACKIIGDEIHET
jgi:hypothetical protein